MGNVAQISRYVVEDTVRIETGLGLMTREQSTVTGRQGSYYGVLYSRAVPMVRWVEVAISSLILRSGVLH